MDSTTTRTSLTPKSFKKAALALALSSTFAPAANASALTDAFGLITGVLNQPNFTQSSAYTINDDVTISTSDGLTLVANSLTPTAGNGPYPAVIFINSWAMNEYEYTAEAQRLAADGYVVLSYSTRGWGSSGGLIDTAGPKDMDDLSRVIDWLIANAPVDPARIGSAGISYGSGISLIGAAQDSRIKAVAALSSWGDLEYSLYGNQSPSLVWGELLDLSSQLIGRPDPIITRYYNAMLSQKLEMIDEIVAWARVRSPLTYVDKLNANGTAVYLSKNWGDDMFHANSIMKLYEKLEGPKFVDLANGTHAFTEILGMIGLTDNRMFNNVHRWFDYHLKGKNNGIQLEPPVQVEVKDTGVIEKHENYPIATQSQEYYLHPRGLLGGGKLSDAPFQSWWPQTNTINSQFDTVASTGIPALSQMLEDFLAPTITSVPLIAPANGIWFESGRLSTKMKIRGEVNLQLQMEPQSDKAQIIAYLYDMDALGVARLITHMPYTLPATPAGKLKNLNFDLVSTAWDIPAGHKLVLAIDTKDLHYGHPSSSKFKVEFPFSSGKQSKLTVPTL